MFARFLKDESGATAIEYGPIAALIAGAMIGVACCGDLQELLNLTRNSSIYKKEFKAIHRELYTYN